MIRSKKAVKVPISKRVFICDMTDTKNTIRNNVAMSIISAATAPFLVCPLLLLISTSNGPTGLKVADAFVTPDGRSGITRSFNARKCIESFSPLDLSSGSKEMASVAALPPTFFQLHSTQQFEEQQQHKSDHDEDPDDENENSKAMRLLRDAERLRLEAEQMDATLTLQKIAVLEEKLSNDDWLRKQQGQTVKVLYEELRMLERKVSKTDDDIPTREEASSSPSVTSSSPTTWPSEETSYSSSSTSDRYKSDKNRNPNLPPIAGFDDKDLNLYVPIAKDVTKMAPNMTLDERIGLFRDAPELQAHFKEKIQNLLVGPLEEMQELETLKQEFLQSTSSKEKDALLKQIKRLQAKMDENNIGMNSDSGANDPGGVGYSDSILLSPEKLPPLTKDELEERCEAIKALPDILVAVYLQRNGLYNLPVDIATIKIDVGSGGLGVNMNTVNNSATNAKADDDEEKEIMSDGNSGDSDDQSSRDNIVPFDLYENLELAIELDYYDLQLQLLNQALGIRPMPEEVRKDYAMAFRSLPLRVRERYVTENLGIDTLEASVLASDEEKDIDRVIEEISKPLDEELSPLGSFMNLNVKNNGKEPEQPIEPPEYNDVEFIDRSRYLEEFFPSVTKLEDARPSPEDVDLFVSDCLTESGNKPFMVTSKPERVLGGYYVRGTNQLGFDEKNSITANDRLIREVSKRLENHPTLKDSIEFYYILDPCPPTDEEMELEIGLNPLILITGKDPKTMYGVLSPLAKTAISMSGLLSTFLFSVGSCVLNPRVNANIQQTLDSVSSTGSTTTFIDLSWFYGLTLPLFFSFMSIFFAHELGHRIVSTYYKVRKFPMRKKAWAQPFDF